MVMEEAIKDKTAMMEAEMIADQIAQQAEDPEEQEEEDKDSDSDFDDDGTAFRNMKEMRIAAMKAEQSQKQIDIVNGHGQYNEISEMQFLPTVTTSQFIIVAFFHKDFERCKIVDMHLNKIS